MIVLSCDDDVSIGISDDLIGLLEDLRCLGLVLIEVVGLLQQWQLDLIRVCQITLTSGRHYLSTLEWVYSLDIR